MNPLRWLSVSLSHATVEAPTVLSLVLGQQMFYLPIGNPNIIDIVNYINLVLQTNNVLSCSYDNIKNKITYTRLIPQESVNFTLYINTMNAGSFLPGRGR